MKRAAVSFLIIAAFMGQATAQQPPAPLPNKFIAYNSAPESEIISYIKTLSCESMAHYADTLGGRFAGWEEDDYFRINMKYWTPNVFSATKEHIEQCPDKDRVKIRWQLLDAESSFSKTRAQVLELKRQESEKTSEGRARLAKEAAEYAAANPLLTFDEGIPQSVVIAKIDAATCEEMEKGRFMGRNEQDAMTAHPILNINWRYWNAEAMAAFVKRSKACLPGYLSSYIALNYVKFPERFAELDSATRNSGGVAKAHDAQVRAAAGEAAATEALTQKMSGYVALYRMAQFCADAGIGLNQSQIVSMTAYMKNEFGGLDSLTKNKIWAANEASFNAVKAQITEYECRELPQKLSNFFPANVLQPEALQSKSPF